MFKFAARASIPQEDIWALGGLIPFVTELLETGGTIEDATLAGREHLARAGIIDGYKHGGPIPMGIEIYINDKQEEIKGVPSMKAITPGRDTWPYPRQSLQDTKARGLRQRGEGESRKTLAETADAAFSGIKITIPALTRTMEESKIWTRMAQPTIRWQEIITEPPAEESANPEEEPHWPTETTKAQERGEP